MLGWLDGWDDGGFEGLGEVGDGRERGEVGVGRGGEAVGSRSGDERCDWLS